MTMQSETRKIVEGYFTAWTTKRPGEAYALLAEDLPEDPVVAVLPAFLMDDVVVPATTMKLPNPVRSCRLMMSRP